MTKLVIDVSEHQREINWKAIKPHIDGAIIRCGYGDDDRSQDDKYWTHNVEQCEKLGIPYGVYLYSYASSDSHAKSEVAHALRLLSGHKPTLPVYIDLEESRYGTFAKRCADIFCKAIAKAGYTAGVYTFESFYNQFMRGYKSYTLWIARYNANTGQPSTKPRIGVDYDAWQYTSNGTVPGYAGRLDISLFYKDFAPGKKTSTAADVLKVAKAELGKTDGTKYGKWYEKNVDKNAYNYDFGARGVPWCAMFASWVLDQAGVKCAGLPGAYCPTMLQAAKDAKATVSKANAKPGDIVYFDWDGGVSDHVGIVVSANPKSSTMQTIEGNADGGIVAMKTRNYTTIVGVARPKYGAEPEPAPKPAGKVIFRVSTDSAGKTWRKDCDQGAKGKAIRWIAIKNVGRYRVYTKRGGWLPWVDNYNTRDLNYGCAGDGSPIIGVQVESDDFRYAVRVKGRSWYPDMVGLHDTGGSNDNFAGDLANEIDGFRIGKA
jgi:lysozyme